MGLAGKLSAHGISRCCTHWAELNAVGLVAHNILALWHKMAHIPRVWPLSHGIGRCRTCPSTYGRTQVSRPPQPSVQARSPVLDVTLRAHGSDTYATYAASPGTMLHTQPSPGVVQQTQPSLGTMHHGRDGQLRLMGLLTIIAADSALAKLMRQQRPANSGDYSPILVIARILSAVAVPQCTRPTK